MLILKDNRAKLSSGIARRRPLGGKGWLQMLHGLLLRFAFEDLKLERLVAVVVPENIAYWKLLEHIWIKNR